MDVRRLAELWGGPLLTAGLLLALVPSRPDRLGHFLAGYGATLLAAWLAARVGKGPWALVLATLACVALGEVVERVIFPLGGPDGLDVAAQSAGAVQAGLALVLGRAGDPDHDWVDRDRLSPAPYGRLVLATALVALVLGAWRAFA